MKYVRMFQPRFAALVKAGTKLQTIRAVPKRIPKAGEPISLRMWSGLPYRSPQVILQEATVTKVQHITITAKRFIIDNARIDSLDEWALAIADGFATPGEMTDWFNSIYGLPFHGILIKWALGGDRPVEITKCPGCGSNMLWSEDRGAHCDGCDYEILAYPATCAVDECSNPPVCELCVDGDWFPVCHTHSVNRLMPRRSCQIKIPAKIPDFRSLTRPQTTANELRPDKSRPTNHPETLEFQPKSLDLGQNAAVVEWQTQGT